MAGLESNQLCFLGEVILGTLGLRNWVTWLSAILWLAGIQHLCIPSSDVLFCVTNSKHVRTHVPDFLEAKIWGSFSFVCFCFPNETHLSKIWKLEVR